MSKKNVFAQYGEPAHNTVSVDILQTYKDTCAIKAQQLVLQRHGIHVTEDQMVKVAIEHGWYEPGHGTSMDNVGRLLEYYGVPMHQYAGGNICNVVNELALGHDVIMSVDSGELWHPGGKEKLEDLLNPYGADHALIVSGVNTDDPKNVKVIVTDPGSGDVCREYSLAQFVDAANDSHFFMVTTDNPSPGIFDSFGLGIDHLPVIGDMTYGYFRQHYAFISDIQHRDAFQEFVNHINSQFVGNQDGVYYSDDYGDDWNDNGEHDDDGDLNTALDDNPADDGLDDFDDDDLLDNLV